MFCKLLITFSKVQLASTRHTLCLLFANMRTQTNLAKIGNSDPFQHQSKYTRAKRLHLNTCSFTQFLHNLEQVVGDAGTQNSIEIVWQRVGLKAMGVPPVCRWLASTGVSLEETLPAFLQVPSLESRVWLEFQALGLTVRGLSGSCHHHNRTCRAAHCLLLVSVKHSTNLMNLRSSPRSTFQQAGLKNETKGMPLSL